LEATRGHQGGLVTPQEALAYALSLPIATLVSGMGSPRDLKQNLAIARGFKALPARRMEALRRRVSARAANGRFELYKIAAAFEGNEARGQHGLPLPGGLEL
jgi:hypothetical protein